MTNYIQEYGLKKIQNASADPLKQPTITIAKGQITLNKAAVRRMNINSYGYYEVHSGRQSGSVLFALVEVPEETEDSIKANVVKKIGIGKIPFKFPLTQYNLSTGNTALDVDLVECDEGTLVFAVLLEGTDRFEEEEEEYINTKPRRVVTTAPFGQMTTYRESGPIIDEDGQVIEGSSGGGGVGTKIEGSDF